MELKFIFCNDGNNYDDNVNDDDDDNDDNNDDDNDELNCIQFFVLKIDLPQRSIQKDDINKFCKEHSFLGWTEMSVKDNKHVAETME